MSAADRWEMINRLFHEAADLAPARRRQFLDQACAGDPLLREEIESLLRADSDSTGVLDETVRTVESEYRSHFGAGKRIGPYQLISEIGHGGMGEIFLAERTEGGFQQRVALKLLRRGMGQDFARHFLQERQILAGLVHPHIARLLDGGETAEGAPYFVMEHVEGVPIDRYCHDHALDTAVRLRLFQSVCDAVNYAHRNLIVHRDLKPDNILVDAEGKAKLLDFGIAKLLAPSTLAETRTAARLMTLDYASPEQVRGEPITTATDVYSLGAVLYSLLTDRLPHASRNPSAFEVQKAIVEMDPPKPSVLMPGLDPDLDAIVMMALRKEPDRRYRSVEQMSDDVGRYLARKPVVARRGTLRYRSLRFIQRHRIAAAVAIAVAIALTATTAIALRQARRAERRFEQVRRLAGSFLFDFEGAIHNLAGATEARHMVVKTGLEYLESLTQDAGNDRALLQELADAYGKIARIQSASEGANVGDSPGALVSIRKAQALRERLGAATGPPALRQAYIQGWLQQADVQVTLKDFTAVRASLNRAQQLVQELRRSDPANRDALALDAQVHRQIATIERRNGRLTSALEAGRYALAISEQLAAASPQDPRANFQLASDEMGMGEAQRRLGNAAEAEKHFRRRMEIVSNLAVRSPEDANTQRQLMISYAQLGDITGSPNGVSLGHLAEAGVYYQKAIELAQRASQSDPGNYTAVSDLMALESRIATMLEVSGDLEGALRHDSAGHELAGRLVAKNPRDGEAQLNEALTGGHVANVLRQLRRFREAVAVRQRSAATYAALLKQTPDDVKVVASAMVNLEGLAVLQVDAGDSQAAVAEFARALEAGEKVLSTHPDDGDILHLIPQIYVEAGKLAEDRREWNRSLELYRNALDRRSRLPASDASRNGGLEEGRRCISRVEARIDQRR